MSNTTPLFNVLVTFKDRKGIPSVVPIKRVTFTEIMPHVHNVMMEQDRGDEELRHISILAAAETESPNDAHVHYGVQSDGSYRVNPGAC